MKLRLRRPRDLALALREVARMRPREAEEYLDTHEVEWAALVEADPADAADILEAIDEEAAADLMVDLDAPQAALLLEEMQDEVAAELLEEMTPVEAAALVSELSAEEAADIVGHLDQETRDSILDEMEDQAAGDILDVLQYPADSAGGLMETDVTSLPMGITTSEAIEALRRLHEHVDQMNYVYVVDATDRLVGVVSFRDLVFARPGTGLDEVMIPDPVAVTAVTDREEVAELIQRYGLIAMPVVDHSGTLVGVVPFDNVIEAVQREASEDIAVMVGAGVEETIYSSFQRSVRHRLPWLIINLGTAMVVTFTISRFEGIISRLAVLAAYMPVVASMGGNSGAQSQAVVIRTMAVDQIPVGAVRRVMLRELIVGLINGIAIGLVAGLIAGYFTGQFRIGLVIGIAALANLVVANLAGSGIPVLLDRMGKDPALGSNILMTTVTDLMGFGGFLTIATLLL